jgi:A/G-specific adenine glycosylase
MLFDAVSQLDGNVSRLISRLLAIHAPPKSKASLDLLWRGAQTMVDGATRAGDVNQALIELGSTVCKPRDPDCSGCPLQRWCRAHQISKKVTRYLTGPASAVVLTSHQERDWRYRRPLHPLRTDTRLGWL